MENCFYRHTLLWSKCNVENPMGKIWGKFKYDKEIECKEVSNEVSLELLQKVWVYFFYVKL